MFALITDQDAKENTDLQEFRVNIERAVEYLLQCKSLHFSCYDLYGNNCVFTFASDEENPMNGH